jgi:molecular chaperone GrpE
MPRSSTRAARTMSEQTDQGAAPDDAAAADDARASSGGEAAGAASPGPAPAEDREGVPGGEPSGAASPGPAPAEDRGGVPGGEPSGAASPGTGPAESAAGSAEAEASAEPEAPSEPDYKDQYLRAVAEADNVRKRARRDVAAAEARGVGRLVRELLPALDNLDRAIAAAETAEGPGDHHLTHGIRLVQQELAGALTRVGVVAESPKGEAFDPHRHEAVAQMPVEGTQAGIVVEVYQPGYRYDDTILRAAKVVVSA